MLGDKWHNALFSVAGLGITLLANQVQPPAGGYSVRRAATLYKAIASIEGYSDRAIQHASAYPGSTSRYAQKNVNNG